MDRANLLKEVYIEKHGEIIGPLLLESHRESTIKQHQVAWKTFQNWLRDNPDKEITENNVLEFCLHLHERGLSSRTINNYKTALTRPLKLIANIDVTTGPFTMLLNAFFIKRPNPPPRIPDWSLDKVLTLLKSRKYRNNFASEYDLLKKTTFLVGLATGNRVSELAAATRNTLILANENSKITIPVTPGFLYKNQRAGRHPPPIEIEPLEGTRELCPVKTLIKYIKKGPSTGSLFINSKSKRPLKANSISRIISSLVKEANPEIGKEAQGHDLRRISSSLAWANGVRPDEIAKRAFWTSTHPFITRYLVGVKPTTSACIALGSQTRSKSAPLPRNTSS